MAYMVVNGAKEGNLKDISLEIPKNKFVVFTGLSGSGKSTLAVDVIYQECQRQYLEAMGYQGIRKPDVVSVSHASPAILITQNGYNRNPRSSVGTVTDIYTDLRMVFEKLGTRTCPNVGRRSRRKRTISRSTCTVATVTTEWRSSPELISPTTPGKAHVKRARDLEGSCK